MTVDQQLAEPSLDHAIDRAVHLLTHTQRDAPDGERVWDAPGDLGPAFTAQALVVLARARRLSDHERAEGARWLRAQQRGDGGFPAYPLADASDVGATASAWAALHTLDREANREAIARARDYVDAHGGTSAVVKRLGAGDLGAVYLALAGLLDAHELPSPFVAWTLLDPLVDWLETRFSPELPLLSLQLSVIVRRLRGDFGPDGKDIGWLARLEVEKCLALLDEYRNAGGDWNANTMQTALAEAALWAAGLREDDPRRDGALAWLKTQARHDADGLWFQSFGSGVWSTAFNLTALLASGVAPADARVTDAVRWLLGSQCRRPQPRPNNRQPDAVRTGGWAFQRGNDTMVDCDDTGVVLTTLGEALAAEGPGAFPPALASEVRAATERAVRWLESMQNPDGGWAAFVWGLPGKPPGPAMEKPLDVDFSDPLSMLAMVLHPPLALGDPSTEDLTGRVLCGLGALGRRADDPVVARALGFLRYEQCGSGALWARWTLNFVAGTSWTLLGAVAVGADLNEPWLRRAIEWLEARQNADGGWGETPASYPDPSLAGVGPSMPPLTGLALQALVAVGRADGAPAARAVEYLLRTQRDDGSWPDERYLVPNIPPDTFYTYFETAKHNPLTGLARYRAALRDRRHSGVR